MVSFIFRLIFALFAQGR